MIAVQILQGHRRPLLPALAAAPRDPARAISPFRRARRSGAAALRALVQAAPGPVLEAARRTAARARHAILIAVCAGAGAARFRIGNGPAGVCHLHHRPRHVRGRRKGAKRRHRRSAFWQRCSTPPSSSPACRFSLRAQDFGLVNHLDQIEPMGRRHRAAGAAVARGQRFGDARTGAIDAARPVSACRPCCAPGDAGTSAPAR